MHLLHIAFQEGFDDDSVIVRINGKEMFRKDDLKTRSQIGYAGSFETNSHEGPVTIDILLPNKNLSQTGAAPTYSCDIYRSLNSARQDCLSYLK